MYVYTHTWYEMSTTNPGKHEACACMTIHTVNLCSCLRFRRLTLFISIWVPCFCLKLPSGFDRYFGTKCSLSWDVASDTMKCTQQSTIPATKHLGRGGHFKASQIGAVHPIIKPKPPSGNDLLCKKKTWKRSSSYDIQL